MSCCCVVAILVCSEDPLQIESFVCCGFSAWLLVQFDCYFFLAPPSPNPAMSPNITSLVNNPCFPQGICRLQLVGVCRIRFLYFFVIFFCFRLLWWWHWPAQNWRYISNTSLPGAVPCWLTMHLESRSSRKWQDYSKISVRVEYIL